MPNSRIRPPKRDNASDTGTKLKNSFMFNAFDRWKLFRNNRNFRAPFSITTSSSPFGNASTQKAMRIAAKTPSRNSQIFTSFSRKAEKSQNGMASSKH